MRGGRRAREGGLAEGAFAGGEDAAPGIARVRGQEETAAGGADAADGAAAAVEGVGAGRLVEVADGDDGGSGAFAEGFEGGEGAADVLVAVGVVAAVEVGHEGIDDDQGGLGAEDDRFEDGDIAGDDEGAAELAAIGDGEEGDDAAGVAAGGVDAGADGVVQVVFG